MQNYILLDAAGKTVTSYLVTPFDPNLGRDEALPWIPVSDEVRDGWTTPDDGKTFVAPAQRPVEPAGNPTTIVFRADLFRRCTEDEAEKIDAALAQQSVRLRRIFESVQAFRSDDELWPTLHDAAVGLFGADRAAVLLAGSA